MIKDFKKNIVYYFFKILLEIHLNDSQNTKN